MQLTSISTGFFKLDGGAMFGIVPKTLWQRLNPPDEHNLCTWAMRCLLIEQGDRKILVDTGIGDKQGEKFKQHFQPHGDTTLLQSLAQHGLAPEDITDVFLTHLHFDHVGGAVSRDDSGTLFPTFPNATYWSNQRHWDWAMEANPREKASFLKENFLPLKGAGQLEFIPWNGEGKPVDWLPGIRVHFVNGHTEAMMLLQIKTPNGTVLHCADLMPSAWHIRLPYIMAYDLRALTSLEEKTHFLSRALEEKWLLFFEHDPQTECGYLTQDEKGRTVLEKEETLANVLNQE